FERDRFGAARAVSIIRRMASERGGLSSCFAAHASIASRISGESLIAVTGSRPVAGRPLFFGTTPIDFFIFRYYQNRASRASASNTRPALTTELLEAAQWLKSSLS